MGNYNLAQMIGAPRLKRGLWWGKAWSLVEGCTPISEGCVHCWARAASHMRACQQSLAMQRRHGGLTNDNGQWTGISRFQEQDLLNPLHTRKPRVFSVWNDLFHCGVPDECVDRALAVMTLCPQHVFMVLTKRLERAADYFADTICRMSKVGDAVERLTKGTRSEYWSAACGKEMTEISFLWPLPNVGIGTTVESAKHLDRIETLRRIPAVTKFVSFEPLLGPIDVHPYLWQGAYDGPLERAPEFDWAIIGCESGGKRRECKIEWVRDLTQQLVEAKVPVFIKQLQVGPNRKPITDMNDPRWPDDLKLRQLPDIARSE